MAIGKRLRFEVLKRDMFTCQYCGRKAPEVILEVDHVHPRSRGGADTMENLRSSCQCCNRGKAAVPLTVGPADPPEDFADWDPCILLWNYWWQSIPHEDAETVFKTEHVRFLLGKGLSRERMEEAIDEIASKINIAGTAAITAHGAWSRFREICWGKVREAEGWRR